MPKRFSDVVLPSQAEVLSYQGSECGLRGAVRSGKTFSLMCWMFDRLMQYPKARHCIIGGDLPQLKGGALADFQAYLKAKGVDFDYRSTDGQVVIKENGATLIALSAEIRQRVLGRSYDSVWLEEPQTWSDGEQTYYSLHTRLSKSPEGMLYYPDMYPQMRMSFNPRQVPIGHWIYNLLVVQKSMPEFVFRTVDNFLLQYKGDERDGDGIDGYCNAQRRTLPENLWNVELEGEWATFGGGVYRYYKQATHGKPPEKLPEFKIYDDKPIKWSLDFNIAWQRSVLAQEHNQTPEFHYHGQLKPIRTLPEPSWQEDVLYIVGEIAINDKDANQVVEEFLKLDKPWAECIRQSGVEIHGDPSGANRSSNSKESNYIIIANALNRAGIKWWWCVESADPGIECRVNECNAQFWTADGAGIVVDEKVTPVLVQDLQGVQWKKNSVKADIDKDSHPELTHAGDALSYLVAYYRRSRAEKLKLRDLVGVDWMSR